MMKFSVEDEGSLYFENDDYDRTLIPLGYYPRILDAANALSELRKTFDKAQANPTDVTRYHEGVYPFGIVLEIDGEPMGMVRMVDDMYCFVPFKQHSKDDE